jgi:transcriptional regulator with XRE-family HTH domain
MARPTARKKSEVAVALAELRKRMGMTQTQFAIRAGLAVPTVAKYESRPPLRGAALEVFEKIAAEEGHTDLVAIFAATRRVTGEDIMAVLHHVLPQRDKANQIIAREIRFRVLIERVAPHMDEATAKAVREDQMQCLFDLARDYRDWHLEEMRYERDSKGGKA